jgi:hypothetical protein
VKALLDGGWLNAAMPACAVFLLGSVFMDVFMVFTMPNLSCSGNP